MSDVEHPPLAEARETGIEKVDVLPASLVARSTQGLPATNKDGLGTTVVVADHWESTQVAKSCNLCNKRRSQCIIYTIIIMTRNFAGEGMRSTLLQKHLHQGGAYINLACLSRNRLDFILFHLPQVLISDNLGHYGCLRVGRTQLKVRVGIADPEFIWRALPDREDIFKGTVD